MNYFTFDGIDSRTYNTYIATSNAFDAPGREDEVIKVPGSNNIYYLTEGTYKPFDIKLYCYIPSNMQVKTDDLRNFLLSKGTCTYTEAIRPNEFRVARFIEAYELDVSDRVSAAFVLTFKAQPQRYLTTNTPITTTATADTTTDTTLSLSTVPTPISISLNGNTTQEGTPTPTSPIEVKSVNGDNEVVVCGKNVLGLDLFADETFYNVNENGSITVKLSDSRRWATVPTTPTLPQGTYTFYRELGYGLCDIRFEYENYGTAHLVANTVKTYTFTLTQPSKIKMKLGYSYSSYPFTETVQLEQGSTATTYEPYTRQSYPLNLGSIELNKIGTYQDYIYKNGGKWYVHKEIGRYVFIGTNEEGWTLTSSYTNNTRYTEAIITARTSGSALSNYFTKGTAGTDTTNIDINGSNGRIMITIPNTIASTVNDLKTWLSTHNTEVYYVLATATNTEITDTTLINQLNNIEKAYSYNGTTNILQVSNDNGFMLGVVSLHSNNVSSAYKGEPIITVNSTGLIYFNGCVIKVNQAPMTINSQTMQAYNGVVNLNNYIEANDFPMIEAGTNVIGSEMPLSIVPNYWKL